MCIIHGDSFTNDFKHGTFEKNINVGLILIDLIQKLLNCFLFCLKTPLIMLCSFSLFHIPLGKVSAYPNGHLQPYPEEVGGSGRVMRVGYPEPPFPVGVG